jgi:flavin-dependent dehydrogenase
VFPKRDHVNVGIGYVLDHYRRQVGEAPYAVQRELIDELKRRGVVDGDSDEERFTPFLIPVGGPLARPGRGRVLLAGDAGGFVNGFTAEGIYYAMVTGDLAARAVAAETPVDVRTLASRYRRACDREIGAELRDSVVIQRYLFGHPRRIAQVVAAVPGAPRLTRAFLDYAIGRTPYSALRRALFTRVPVLGTRLITKRLMNWVIG